MHICSHKLAQALYPVAHSVQRNGVLRMQDRQEATSGPGPRGPFSAQGRETLAASLEDDSVSDATLQRVSDIVQGHMVIGEDGSEELDLFVRFSSVWNM
jgi:hypothetical protein